MAARMSVPVKTMIYLETRMTGHRPSYLRRVVNIAIKHQYRVLLAMPANCFEHSVVKQLLESHPAESLSSIHCSPLDTNRQSSNVLQMLYDEYCCTRFFNEAVYAAKKIHAIDLVMAGMFDDASIYSGLVKYDFSGIPWVGVIMRQNFHFKTMNLIGPPELRMNSVKKSLLLRFLSSMKKEACLLTIDRTLKAYIDEYHTGLANRIEFLPDAVDDRGEISNLDMRSQIGIPADAVVILCYGTLRENKGIRLLLGILEQLPDNVHVLLTGTQHEAIKNYINSESNKALVQSGRLHQIERYIDVIEDPGFFATADIVWIAYKDYYSMSAVLVQAAQYSTPVIATQAGLVGKLTTEFNTGIVVDTTNKLDVLRGINELISSDENEIRRRYADLVEEHSLDTFEKRLISSFDKVMV